MHRFLSSLIICLTISFSSTAADSALESQVNNIKNIENREQAIQAFSGLRESLDDSLSKSKVDIAQVYYLIEGGQIKRARDVAQQAINFAEFHDLDSQLAIANKLEAVTHYYLGDYEQSIDGYRATLVYYRMINDHIQEANLLNNIGLVQIRLAEYDDALISYKEAQHLYQRYGSEQDQVDIQRNLGVLYIALRQYDEAISAYEGVIAWYKVNAPTSSLMETYGEYSVALKYAKQFEEAKEYGIQAVEYYQGAGNQYKLAASLHNLAEVFYELGDINQAKHNSQRAVHAARAAGHKKALSGALYTLAKSNFSSVQIAPAIEQLEEANQIAEQAKDDTLMVNIYWLYAMIYANTGDLEKARAYQGKAISKQHSLSNASLNEKLARYQSTELALEVEQLKQAQALEEAKSKQQFQYWLFLTIGIILFGFISFFMFSRNAERRAKHILTQQLKQRSAKVEELSKELSETIKAEKANSQQLSSQLKSPVDDIDYQLNKVMTKPEIDSETKSALADIQENVQTLRNKLD